MRPENQTGEIDIKDLDENDILVFLGEAGEVILTSSDHLINLWTLLSSSRFHLAGEDFERFKTQLKHTSLHDETSVLIDPPEAICFLTYLEMQVAGHEEFILRDTQQQQLLSALYSQALRSTRELEALRTGWQAKGLNELTEYIRHQKEQKKEVTVRDMRSSISTLVKTIDMEGPDFLLTFKGVFGMIFTDMREICTGYNHQIRIIGPGFRQFFEKFVTHVLEVDIEKYPIFEFDITTNPVTVSFNHGNDKDSEGVGGLGDGLNDPKFLGKTSDELKRTDIQTRFRETFPVQDVNNLLFETGLLEALAAKVKLAPGI